MATVGYARVSSRGQSLDIQRQRLSFCDKLFEETHTGTRDDRPQLRACLDYIREGDTLVITKLDRLARSTLHLCQIVEKLKVLKVELRALDQSIDTTTSTGRLMLNVLSVIAQFETEIRAERQCEGIRKAKERGVRFGARHRLSDAQIAELKEKRSRGVLIRDLMKEYGISKVTVYRYLNDDYLKVEPDEV
jgi:DNA invertase Pin-like site-specific DNA recombinase